MIQLAKDGSLHARRQVWTVKLVVCMCMPSRLPVDREICHTRLLAAVGWSCVGYLGAASAPVAAVRP